MYRKFTLKSNVRLKWFTRHLAESVRLKWVFDLSVKFTSLFDFQKIVIIACFSAFSRPSGALFLQSVRLKWVFDLSV